MGEKTFALIFGVILICIGIGYIAYPMIMLNNRKQIVGDIVNIKTAVPERMKKNNSKWAVIRIKIDDEEYYSDFLQIPMEMNIGAKIDVTYDGNNPREMCLAKRNMKGFMFLGIGILVLLYGKYISN